MNHDASDQLVAALRVVDDVLAGDVAGAYLFGSAVVGGLRAASDLDLLVVSRRETTPDNRRALVDKIRPISRRKLRPTGWRPLELTVVLASEVCPLSPTPRTDFQYGEWLHERFDAGQFEPAEPLNPDSLVMLAQVRRTGRALRGPDPRELIDDVPPVVLQRALFYAVPSLVSDLATDTTNVLLTLARILHTLETGEFTTKDGAAQWAAARMVQGTALTRAAAVYRGEIEGEWAQLDREAAVVAADELVERISG